jgi:hypothetical protein
MAYQMDNDLTVNIAHPLNKMLLSANGQAQVPRMLPPSFSPPSGFIPTDSDVQPSPALHTLPRPVSMPPLLRPQSTGKKPNIIFRLFARKANQ